MNPLQLPEQFTLPRRIQCLLSIDADTSLWIGHCLDFDIVTSGKTANLAWSNLKSVVKLHIEHSFTHDRAGLNRRRAPEAAWMTLDQLSSKSRRSDKIELDLVEKPPAEDIWISGVELGTISPEIPSVH